jgi:hypothetical protein
MRTRNRRMAILGFIILHSAFCLSTWGQYSIDWLKVSGGGGTSTGGVYTVSGTVGQPEAGTMTGGDFSLTGGFWSIIAAVQTPGAPTLTITNSGSSVMVSWPNPSSGFVLQQSPDLANPATWSSYGGTVSTNGGVNSINITPPAGNLFFRLYHP